MTPSPIGDGQHPTRQTPVEAHFKQAGDYQSIHAHRRSVWSCLVISRRPYTEPGPICVHVRLMVNISSCHIWTSGGPQESPKAVKCFNTHARLLLDALRCVWRACGSPEVHIQGLARYVVMCIWTSQSPGKRCQTLQDDLQSVRLLGMSL